MTNYSRLIDRTGMALMDSINRTGKILEQQRELVAAFEAEVKHRKELFRWIKDGLYEIADGSWIRVKSGWHQVSMVNYDETHAQTTEGHIFPFTAIKRARRTKPPIRNSKQQLSASLPDKDAPAMFFPTEKAGASR